MLDHTKHLRRTCLVTERNPRETTETKHPTTPTCQNTPVSHTNGTAITGQGLQKTATMHSKSWLQRLITHETAKHSTQYFVTLHEHPTMTITTKKKMRSHRQGKLIGQSSL
jgi:hypothetical protein